MARNSIELGGDFASDGTTFIGTHLCVMKRGKKGEKAKKVCTALPATVFVGTEPKTKTNKKGEKYQSTRLRRTKRSLDEVLKRPKRDKPAGGGGGKGAVPPPGPESLACMKKVGATSMNKMDAGQRCAYNKCLRDTSKKEWQVKSAIRKLKKQGC
jgi:hypothetical protein